MCNKIEMCQIKVIYGSVACFYHLHTLLVACSLRVKTRIVTHV